MKKIEIQGKRNQDKMKQMYDDPGAIIERKTTQNKKIFIPDEFYAIEQTHILKLLNGHNADISLGVGYSEQICIPTATATTTTMSHDTTITFNRENVLSYILREIDAKRKAYIYQDKHHNIYDPRYTINTNKIVEFLVEAKLLCHYCREICQVIYKEVMCRKQWTLDRIDNNYGHNDANVVIACLDCNLKRGTMDAERFRQGKQFTFRKIE
jgi:5-methylcytosine-specific restriction endonuclease McrA